MKHNPPGSACFIDRQDGWDSALDCRGGVYFKTSKI